MASLESFTRETSNHSNHPRLASYTARVRLGESGQLDRQCLTSLTTLNASTSESVSGEYAAIKEGTSTSAAAVHCAANVANNYINENTPMPDLSRNARIVRYILNISIVQYSP